MVAQRGSSSKIVEGAELRRVEGEVEGGLVACLQCPSILLSVGVEAKALAGQPLSLSQHGAPTGGGLLSGKARTSPCRWPRRRMAARTGVGAHWLERRRRDEARGDRFTHERQEEAGLTTGPRAGPEDVTATVDAGASTWSTSAVKVSDATSSDAESPVTGIN